MSEEEKKAIEITKTIIEFAGDSYIPKENRKALQTLLNLIDKYEEEIDTYKETENDYEHELARKDEEIERQQKEIERLNSIIKTDNIINKERAELIEQQREKIEERETRLQEEINENCKLKTELYGNSISKDKIRNLLKQVNASLYHFKDSDKNNIMQRIKDKLEQLLEE